MEELLIGGPCYLEGSESCKSLQTAMPELAQAVHEFYDQQGFLLLTYIPPMWLEEHLLERGKLGSRGAIAC